MRQFFTKYKGFHILFWTADLVFWTAFSYKSYHTSLPEAFISIAIWLLIQAAFVYAIIYWLLPRYFYQKKYGQFGGIAFLLLIASALLIAWIEIYLISGKRDNIVRDVFYFSLFIAMTNFYTAFMFMAAKMIKNKILSDRHQQAVEKERTENELRFLKSQMNPHFLFNAINSIYVLIRKDQDMAAGTLATFADMLRYQLYECNTPYIPIEREIYYLNNYVQLEQLRKGKTLQLDYQVAPTVANFSIAPLLLLPFVENAYKYVSAYTNNDNYIRLHLNYQHPVFTLEIDNSTDATMLTNDDSSGGIGLENVKRRLELIYKGNYHLQITPGAGSYRVLLTINIV